MYYKNSIAGNSVSEFKIKFNQLFEYSYIQLGKIGTDYLSIAVDNYNKNWCLYRSSSINTISSDGKITDLSYNGLKSGEDIKIKTVAFGEGVLVYANDELLTAYTGTDAADFVSQPGINVYGSWNSTYSVYIDCVKILREPVFEDLAVWNIVSENFDAFEASETTSDVTSNTRLALTEQANNLSYTQASVDDLSVLKMVLAKNGALSYQTHAGFRVNSNLRDNYVIETKLRADADSLPQGIIINLGKKDGTTNETIGFAMASYRKFYGMTAYGTDGYYNQQKYVGAVCGDDVNFRQTDWHTYRFVVNGSTIKVYIDGILKMTYENENMTTNGNIGIRFTSANQANPTVYVDSFSVKSTAPQTTKLHCMKKDNGTEISADLNYEIAEGFAYESGTVFMAVYEDGKLVNIKMKNINFDSGMLSETFSIGQKKTAGKTYEVKAFTWDNGFKPIFDVK